MKTETVRSLEQLVEEQIKKWQSQRSEKKTKPESYPLRTCITISRDPGSGGTKIAQRLAQELGMDVVGRDVIQQVAERSDLSEKLIATLDEKDVRLLDSFLESFFLTRHIWPNEYLKYLTRVIAAIGKQGNMIIIGRGGQFILPPGETFRVRFVAPREIRIRNVMRDSGSDFENAENYVIKTEEDRNAFHRKHFGADWTDSSHYDLIVNTGSLGLEGSVTVVKAAFAEWLKHLSAPPADSKG